MENDKKEEPETRSLAEGAQGKGYSSSSNNLPSDQRQREELTKVFEKNLKGLENLVKLFKSDVSKMFDISDPGSVRPTICLSGRSTCEKQDIKHCFAKETIEKWPI
ncbi:unnamed protein product [Rhizophagus irregularis]|nr:unnamed protein product [Rhizophagus irregularis]